MASRFQVIVGNLGTVHEGDYSMAARREFKAYVELSKEGSGRAGGEPVTLMERGEIIAEHIPPEPRPFTFGIRYLETCQPDFCNGYDGHMIAVALWPRIRNRQVRKKLIEEIAKDDMYGAGYSIGRHDEVQAVIHEDWAIEQMVESVRELFRGEDGRKAWSRISIGEGCYAYFGVTIEEN